MPPAITVVIPSFNPQPDQLAALYQSLLDQSLQDFEVLLVDDASRELGAYEFLQDPRFRVLRRPQNKGPAACRNAGAAEAAAPLIFLTDTDCRLAPESLAAAVETLAGDPISVGNTITDTCTVFGKAVAFLGFPGGGSIGFHNVWRVSPEGYSTSFSTCNVAFQKRAYQELGGFNEAFPIPGGEDTVLARQALERGVKMRYTPEQIVYHVERGALRDFLRWQVIRGRGNYYIKQYVRSVGGYLKLRVWTFKNSFRHAGPLYGPLVALLILLSVLCQLFGFQLEKRRVARSRE